MKDSNEKDELRFDKLYRLLGDEINEIYEENSHVDTNIITQNEENNDETEPLFNDIFNIFNDQNHNNDAFINTVNNQDRSKIKNDEYLKELNSLIDNYNKEVNNETKNSSGDIYNQESGTFKKELENNYEIKELTDEFKNDGNIVNIETPIINEELLNNHNQTTEIINEEIFIEPTKIELKDALNNEIDNKSKKNNFSVENKNKIRNKTIISSKNMYDDGLDELYSKKSIIDILANRKTINVLLIIIFIVMLILVIKAFHFGKLVNIYNEYTNELNKTDENTRIYDDNAFIDMETLKKAAASELIDCINSKVDTNKLPDEVNNVIKEINNYYHESGKYFAFAYKDLFTGFTVSYNENGNIFAASTIKAPVNIYLYEEASQGKINLDDELTYTANYYNNGTGVLKNKSINTKYSIRTLSEYAIRNSDNAAHNMLMDKYGRNNIKKYWQDKGTNIILTGNDNWGLINAHDAMIYMKELYTFYINNNEYGNELMNNFINAKTKFITGKNNYQVANKTGWSGNSQHDVAIVFADNPYLIVALSNLGYDDNYMNHFNKVNDLTFKLHNEYWKYKMAICSNIKQHD